MKPVYVLTHGGARFHIEQPLAEDVALDDVAYALSHINRYNGHTTYPFSVAQHCVSVARCLARCAAPEEVQLTGPLHDAHKAYFGDITTPLKRALGESVRVLERRVQQVVLDAFAGVVLPEILWRAHRRSNAPTWQRSWWRRAGCCRATWPSHPA